MPDTSHRRSIRLKGYDQNFKSNTAREINRLRQTPGQPVWHRNYFEHIIRNEDELINTRLYILDNPRQWAEDEHNIQI